MLRVLLLVHFKQTMVLQNTYRVKKTMITYKRKEGEG
jgi:hypothetical protein